MQDNFHVASLLGFTGRQDEEVPNMQPQKQSGSPDGLKLANILMKTLLRNLGYHTVSLIAIMTTTVLPCSILCYLLIFYTVKLLKTKNFLCFNELLPIH